MSSSEKPPPDPIRERAVARIGQTIRGKFHLETLLGVGGMASVYGATHRNGSRVAIKILHDHVSRDPDVRRLFRREALAANRIDHPGVVRVLDDDVAEDGCAFLVMPLLSGETLQARWERLGRRLPERETLIVGLAVLDALAAAHAQGIVHRDIKPGNLFITQDGDVRILDFGVARLLEQSETAAATRAGHAIGTPAFMPPEQALGRIHEIDGQCDLWAVGATLFTCLSGNYVHGAHTANELLIYAATRPAPPLLSAVPEADVRLGAVIDRALAFHKRDRWESAELMRSELATTLIDIMHEPLPNPLRIPVPPAEATSGPRGHIEHADVHSDVTRTPALSSRAAFGPVAGISYRSRWFLAAAAGLAFVVGTLVLRRALSLRTHDHVDVGMSSKGETEAKAAYQSWRDAATVVSADHIAKAVAASPTLARAHLLRAIEGFWSDEPSRNSFREAWEYRSQLSEKENAILRAYQPILDAVPDPAAANRNLVSVFQQYPTYDLAAYCLSTAQLRLGKLDDAQRTMESFLRIDAGFAEGWYVVGETHVFSGDVQGAKSAYRQCLAISPYATDCLSDISLLDENEGDCKDAENLSRTWLTAQPDSSQAFRRLANAVFGRGGSIEAAREISAQSLLVLTPADRRFGAARREMTLGILRGDFGLALDQATAAESALESSDEEPHERTALSIMRIQRELGNMDEVVRTADNFAKRRDVWVKNDYFDYSIVPQTMKYLVGSTTRSEFQKERDAWLLAQAARPELLSYRSFEWILAYAQPVVTEADAQDALSVLPRFLPILDPLSRDADMDLPIGYAYLEAGQLADARRFLERAAHSCQALDEPLSHTLANLYLGESLERMGDVLGACGAYNVVLSRWGKAPGSRSAARAREHATNLACSTEHSQPGAR
ncbi:MAG: protein kinase domain-containing protein [Polyangiaceae bacterium]